MKALYEITIGWIDEEHEHSDNLDSITVLDSDGLSAWYQVCRNYEGMTAHHYLSGIKFIGRADITDKKILDNEAA